MYKKYTPAYPLLVSNKSHLIFCASKSLENLAIGVRTYCNVLARDVARKERRLTKTEFFDKLNTKVARQSINRVIMKKGYANSSCISF